ncbi:MAG: photosystem II stability/assembly factor-like uncharacterized protein [Spirosomataceae bacterium]|jgi:photosystem II stability/assembly factor-like uncharacterized protein
MRNKAKQLIKNAFLAVFMVTAVAELCQGQSTIKGTSASFRSMSVVSDEVIWAGGSEGTIIRSMNGAKDWNIFTVDSKLDFRGIHAFDELCAVAMSAGEAQTGAAKIYKTVDGGKNWKIVFETTQTGVFLDCLKFKDKKMGYVLGDPIDGKPYVLKTIDGGENWENINPELLPDVTEGEASFAASNSNIFVHKKRVLFSTQDRVFISEDNGASWEVSQTPFEKGSTAGIFGLYFTNEKRGFAVGGDYVDDKSEYPNIAQTFDGGNTWVFTKTVKPFGLKESVWKSGKNELFAVGTSGVSKSTDGGKSWQSISNEPFNVVQCGKKHCFAIGGKGRFEVLK